jgi:hypothetical protein
MMPFGKYKGHDLSEIPDEYLLWLTANIPLREPLRCAITTEITYRDLELSPLAPHLHHCDRRKHHTRRLTMAPGRGVAIRKTVLRAIFPSLPVNAEPPDTGQDDHSSCIALRMLTKVTQLSHDSPMFPPHSCRVRRGGLTRWIVLLVWRLWCRQYLSPGTSVTAWCIERDLPSLCR